MTIFVEYHGQAKAAAGTAGEEVVLPPESTAAALLVALAERHGEALRRFLLGPEGRPQPALLLFAGDTQVTDPEACVLREGEQVLILSPISGG